ncbi:MAG TPA: universal stress protein [Nitrososphaerales archaeon]|nr:universal stress protein [Nitrososphaerales archaeon]
MADRDGFRRILVAVDGSDVSMRALSQAARLAKEEGADLYAVHVVPSPPFEYAGEIADYYDQARRSSSRWMKDVEQEAARRGVSIRTETIVGASSVVDTIVGYADTISGDLIVTGTRGRTPSTRMTMGSIASGLVEAAKCPVLIVR